MVSMSAPSVHGSPDDGRLVIDAVIHTELK
jgi:hypothetical protein